MHVCLFMMDGSVAFHADVLSACALDGWHFMHMPCTPENHPQCILTPVYARLNIGSNLPIYNIVFVMYK